MATSAEHNLVVLQGTSWFLKQVQDVQMDCWSCHPGGQSSWLQINKYPYPWLSAFCSFLHSTSSCKKTTNQPSTQCAFQMVDMLCETGGKDVMKNPEPHTVIPETSHSAKGVQRSAFPPRQCHNCRQCFSPIQFDSTTQHHLGASTAAQLPLSTKTFPRSEPWGGCTQDSKEK